MDLRHASGARASMLRFTLRHSSKPASFGSIARTCLTLLADLAVIAKVDTVARAAEKACSNIWNPYGSRMRVHCPLPALLRQKIRTTKTPQQRPQFLVLIGR